MKCPTCGKTMRPSKKYPGYYLCDNCRKRYPGSSVKSKKKKRKKKSFLPFLFLIIALIAIGCFLYFSGILRPKDTSGNASEPKTTTLSSSETGTLSGIELKINSFKTSNGNQIIKPSSGNTFLFIEVEATNTTEQSVSIQDISNFRALYHSEVIAHSSLAYDALPKKSPRLNGTLEGNSSMTGFVCYELPADFDSIELEYSNPIWYNQKIQFTITQ